MIDVFGMMKLFRICATTPKCGMLAVRSAQSASAQQSLNEYAESDFGIVALLHNSRNS